MELEVEPISPAIGAEVRGIDISQPLDRKAFAAVRAALLKHIVLVFRDNPLNDAQLMAVGQRFGPLIVHPNLRQSGPHPEVVAIRREPGEQSIVGAEWHTDTTCLAAPPMGAVLHAVEAPPVGGDTLFANQHLAYETLSEGCRRMLDDLVAVHDDTRVAGPQSGINQRRSNKVRADADWRPTVSEHPVVRTHPETGRKGLFVNIAYTRRFRNMSAAESAPLLAFLYRHATRPEITCRVRWRAGTTVIWDNRCLKHIALNDCGPHRREMHRVQIAGDRPV